MSSETETENLKRFLTASSKWMGSLETAGREGDLARLKSEALVIKGRTSNLDAHDLKSAAASLQTLVSDSPNVSYAQLVQSVGRVGTALADFSGQARQQIEKHEHEKNLLMSQNRYSYDDPNQVLGDGKVQLLSWNTEVYQARVSRAYVEERIVRALYTRKQMDRTHRVRADHRALVERNFRHEVFLRTPYTQKKLRAARASLDVAEALEAASPRFHDIDDLSPHLAHAALSARGLSSASGRAKPMSLREISRAVQLPPISSLMNPRNQMTSPLPDKETLMPSAERRALPRPKPRGLTLSALREKLAVFLEAKRVADHEVLMHSKASSINGTINGTSPRASPREGSGFGTAPDLARVVHDVYVKEYGAGVTARGKVTMLKESCEAHADHPRVAVFRMLADWSTADEEPWADSTKAACMQLCSWLQISNAKPPPGDSSLELPLSNINSLIQNLIRKELVPRRAKKALKEAAERIELPFEGMDEDGEPYVARTAPMVDADQLLLAWMSLWGSWDNFDLDAPLSPDAYSNPLGMERASTSGSMTERTARFDDSALRGVSREGAGASAEGERGDTPRDAVQRQLSVSWTQNTVQ